MRLKVRSLGAHVHNGEILRAWDRYPVSVASVGDDKAKIGKGKNAWAGWKLENVEAIKRIRR